MRYTFLFLLLLSGISLSVKAQTINQNTGWMFFLNNTKLSEKWGAYVDVQVRSADDFAYVRNILFRPGITYYINGKNEVTLGYLLNETFTRVDGAAHNNFTEHRIWEQYVLKHKIKTISASHRFRLEQRFAETASGNDVFAQRFRYFFRFIIPLQKGIQNFEKGVFAAVQNEVFLNIHNKENFNNHLFDQNRAYAALGYRVSKSLDIEAGYLNQSSKGSANNTVNNVIQIAVYTKF